MVDIHSDEYIIGQNIRKYRKQKGWSQKDLSDAVDIDRQNGYNEGKTKQGEKQYGQIYGRDF